MQAAAGLQWLNGEAAGSGGLSLERTAGGGSGQMPGRRLRLARWVELPVKERGSREERSTFTEAERSTRARVPYLKQAVGEIGQTLGAWKS